MPQDENALEKEIQDKGLDAPRLTPQLIDDTIIYEQYFRVDNTTTTICYLGLKNGFGVVGDTSAVSLENFNEEIGRKSAYANAREKVWQLEAYKLKQELFDKGL